MRAEISLVYLLFNLFPHLMVLENTTLTQRRVRKRSERQAKRVAHGQLIEVGTAEKRDAYPSCLPGGHQSRGATTRVLAMDRKTMLFGEPISGSDPEMDEEVLDVMLDLAREG